MGEFSKEHDVPVHMHLAESATRRGSRMRDTASRPSSCWRSWASLSSRFAGAHGCWLTEADASLLARSGASLVTNPVSNLKLSVGSLFPYRLVKEHAIPYCFGTDGSSSNNGLDMMETMKLASLLGKFSTGDPTFLPAREAHERATKEAARIFSLGDWSITTGSTADIILLDLASVRFVPNFDIYSDIVYSAKSCDVDTVICMGQVLMENKHVEGEEEIMQRAGQIARGLPSR